MERLMGVVALLLVVVVVAASSSAAASAALVRLCCPTGARSRLPSANWPGAHSRAPLGRARNCVIDILIEFLLSNPANLLPPARLPPNKSPQAQIH